MKLYQVFESALLDSILKLAVIPVACAHFPTQFLPYSHLICFDTALCEEPHLSVMTLCDLPSVWMVIFFYSNVNIVIFEILIFDFY